MLLNISDPSGALLHEINLTAAKHKISIKDGRISLLFTCLDSARVDSTARQKVHYISQSIITTPRSSLHVACDVVIASCTLFATI